MENEEDPRALKPGICRVTVTDKSGREWICIKEVHGSMYQRKSSDRNHRRGDPIYPQSPQSDSHYFVVRWPYREEPK